jgi:hypothetical protein
MKSKWTSWINEDKTKTLKQKMQGPTYLTIYSYIIQLNRHI